MSLAHGAGPQDEAAQASAGRGARGAFDADALDLAEQSAGVGVWSIDLTTGLVRATGQFYRIMGLEPTDAPVPVERIRALRHPDDRDRVLAGFRAVVDGGLDAYEMEYRIVRPDGQLRWIFGRGRIVRDASGAPVRFSGVDLDITERKQEQAELAAAKAALERLNAELEARVAERSAALEAEAQRRADAERRLLQAQKMEAIGQLTGGIAHDFNNILQVILGNLQIVELALRGGVGADTPQAQALVRSALDTAQKAVRSAGQLVQRLLAFSRQQALDPRPLDANRLVEGMTDMMERTLGEAIELRTDLAPDAWPTLADRNQLEAALLNLVVNARDAMPRGGRVTIATANVPAGGTGDDDVPAGDYVRLAVSDTGMGIRRDLLDKVFEPFFTTKEVGKGTGLGLSMVYGFVRQSGGHVRIRSDEGAGCCVRLYLPRWRGAASAEGASEADGAADAAPLPRARPGETVLVVEDNDDVRRFGTAALASLGYAVVEARDGASALAACADGGDLHLLFTDVVLPGGLDGRMLADALRTRRPHLPVLFTSGYMRTAPLEAATLVAQRQMLPKPYTLQRLAHAVREALDRAQP